MKILVTGGAGFIGSNFVRNLLAGAYCSYSEIDSVSVLDNLSYAGNVENLAAVWSDPKFRFILGDICDLEVIYPALDGQDLIVHFAAESHVDRSINDSYPFFNTNVIGTQRLLEVARKLNVSTFIYVSTDEVYGTISSGSWSEDSPLLPNSPYAASKAASDLMVRSYHRTYGMDVRTTRCSNNYGPFQYPEKVIPLFVTNLIIKKPLPMYGDGSNVRDWIHVDDHCRGIWLVATRGKAGNVYNIGGRNELSNLELAETILTEMGETRSRIEFVGDRKGHDLRYSVDSSKILAELGFEPKIDFKLGLKSTIDWYISNALWWKKTKGKDEKNM